MADISPSATSTVEGSQSPVTENSYSGWPNAPVPNVSGVSEIDFGSAGDECNILDCTPGSSTSYALGSVPD